jgi:hypothetical protein
MNWIDRRNRRAAHQEECEDRDRAFHARLTASIVGRSVSA